MTKEELDLIRREYDSDPTAMQLVGEIDRLKDAVRKLSNRCMCLTKGTLCGTLCGLNQMCTADLNKIPEYLQEGIK